MGAVKHSRQRDAIKTFLMSRKDHPTADVVYTFVKNDFPCEDGFVHYDANTKPHLHFQCRRCKCLIDITNPSDNEILENLGANVSSHFPGKIEAGSVCFYGLCEKCASEN